MNRIAKGSFGSLFLWLVLLAPACNTSSGPLSPSQVLDVLMLLSPPDKTSYAVGEAFAADGVAVQGNFADGSVRMIPVEKLIFSGFDSSATAAQQTVTITFSGRTVQFTVEIR